jgi:hypothetical protein
VRDGVNLARRGLAAVALVTTEFWPQGDFVARSVGMPDVPRVQLPHPVASTGRKHLREVADDICDEVIARWAGRDPGHPAPAEEGVGR